MKSRSEEGCQEGDGQNAREQSRVTCPGCGYDLSGRVGPRCSECGLALQVVAADQGRFYRQSGVMLLASWAVLIGAVLAVIFGVTVVNEHRWHVEGWEQMQTLFAYNQSDIESTQKVIAAIESRADGSDLANRLSLGISALKQTQGQMPSEEPPTLIDKRLVIPVTGFGLSFLGLMCAALALLANRIVVRSVRDEVSGVGKLERRAGILSFASVWGCSLALVVLAWETIR